MLLFQSSIFWAIERVMSRSHAGIITFANGSRALECTIHNSSASWAELRAEGAAIVPHRLELQEGPSAPRRAARVIWRKPGVLGVRFDDYFLGR
jgi:hypothetical protein